MGVGVGSGCADNIGPPGGSTGPQRASSPGTYSSATLPEPPQLAQASLTPPQPAPQAKGLRFPRLTSAFTSAWGECCCSPKTEERQPLTEQVPLHCLLLSVIFFISEESGKLLSTLSLDVSMSAF